MTIVLFCSVYRHLDYAIKNYANVSALTVGSFGYQLKRDFSDNATHGSDKLSIEACFHRYTNATLNPSIAEYFIDTTPFEQCIEIDPGFEPGSDKWANFSFIDYIQRSNPDQNNFESLLQLTLKLPLRAILLNTIIAYNTPQCFDLDVSVNFDNKAHSGEINIKMVTHTKLIDCHGRLFVDEV